MNELIKIDVQEDGVETVNARDLHELLEVKTRFNDWITGRIEKYDFIIEYDYILLTEKLVSGNNAVSNTYHISLDMAKELSMVENNQKGRDARKYFIAIEKEHKKYKSGSITDLGEAIKIAVTSALEAVEQKGFFSPPPATTKKSCKKTLVPVIQGSNEEKERTKKILSYSMYPEVIYKALGDVLLKNRWKTSAKEKAKRRKISLSNFLESEGMTKVFLDFYDAALTEAEEESYGKS